MDDAFLQRVGRSGLVAHLRRGAEDEPGHHKLGDDHDQHRGEKENRVVRARAAVGAHRLVVVGDCLGHRAVPLARLGEVGHATVTSSLRYTSCTALRKAIPSTVGRWNALRPVISPVPPARLLMTAVRTTSARSPAPRDSPPPLSVGSFCLMMSAWMVTPRWLAWPVRSAAVW